MILQERIGLLSRLGQYILSNTPDWQEVKERAYRENQWFVPEFINKASEQIAQSFLDEDNLTAWANQYQIPDALSHPKQVGIVMAGNIPLVGFHDFLCVFVSGNISVIKPSSKDEVLIKHLIAKLYEWDVRIQNWVSFADKLKGLDAYIATGSNNSSRYFDYYFGKYPHIIRKNRTSVAILDGSESQETLSLLADDVLQYFGLGCRNVTQVYVPENYDFQPLLAALKKYPEFIDYHKYKHNYDYHLALLIMGGKYYMNNDLMVLTENASPFSPVSQLHFAYYQNRQMLIEQLQKDEAIQCIVGMGLIPFGHAQTPGLSDYADGIDTMEFLTGL
ncbi:acyl-CoA reductase [Sediminibacterium salmoneum]|uniref:acyl-CoA reductase n=1 Tax=Sediminibacterium salmoneum TaxID=426421 RepID=UPI00047C03EB|nr:acyl-CoA reductase [Sediminibacterium salmoneum]